MDLYSIVSACYLAKDLYTDAIIAEFNSVMIVLNTVIY